ncbi:MAG: DUF2267 domain-containing protein [Paracoccaceae bacterium]
MSATGLDVFDRTLHVTNTWLHELTSRMGWEDRRAGWRLLRTVLHMLRDRLTAEEAAKFAAQLPMLLRGAFYEGWRPSGAAEAPRTAEAFLAPLVEAFGEARDFEPEAAFRETLAVIRMHVSAGEIEDLRRAMPAAARGFWDED